MSEIPQNYDSKISKLLSEAVDIFVVSEKGHGKTVACMNLAEQLIAKGYRVIIFESFPKWSNADNFFYCWVNRWGEQMEKMTVRPLIYAGVLLLAFGIVSGIVTYHFGFPWGSVIAISAGTWCLLTAIKTWIERKVIHLIGGALIERATDLCSLYNNVERNLSHALQPDTTHETMIQLVQDARDNLRTAMRKMGWKGQF